MQFTEKEIELAKQLKEAGLEWEPEEGDSYICNLKSNRYSIVTGIDYDRGDKGWIYVMSPSDGLRNINLCCWLPLWHQCREIFKETNIELTISDVPGTNVTLTLWKRQGGAIEFYQQIVAEADLEAMYKALLEVLNNVSKNVNDE